MRALPAHLPPNDGALFDVLHAWFGFGNFDPAGELPWWKFRAIEIGKVKRSRHARDKSIAELYIAAMYARAYGLDVRAVTWLYRYIPEAFAWYDAKAAVAVAEDFEQAYANAVRHEMAQEDKTWLDVLVRAQGGEAREEVFAQWLQQQNRVQSG